MPTPPIRLRSLAAFATLAVLALTLVDARGLPSRLRDAEFWSLVTEFSEGGGYFPSDNFVSNEMEYQTVVPALQATIKPGGVYVGVGPDQNFTYISALRPGIVFIVDIRRQNMLHQLLYKALFELSPTRADFLSRLFGRPKPERLDRASTAEALFDAFDRTAPSRLLFDETSRRVFDLLERQHRFALTPDDVATMRYVLGTFFEFGPELSYAPVDADRRFSLPPGLRRSMFPSFAELATRTDGQGVNRGYLATEASYAFLRDLQRRNLIVPVVGDFAGDRALRSVGAWVGERGAVVTTFYTSNVEQYLFQNRVWDRFYANVATMPLDETSTFIRSYFPYGGTIRLNPRVQPFDPANPISQNLFLYPESDQLVTPVREVLAAVADGRVASYLDLIGLSRPR
ncbi:MAG TPA: hypothetical protein VMM93_13270 [Vicinamibacterales bacterium]|nr:hypothetical protein [Vicinamibacterales bacterium]